MKKQFLFNSIAIFFFLLWGIAGASAQNETYVREFATASTPTYISFYQSDNIHVTFNSQRPDGMIGFVGEINKLSGSVNAYHNSWPSPHTGGTMEDHLHSRYFASGNVIVFIPYQHNVGLAYGPYGDFFTNLKGLVEDPSTNLSYILDGNRVFVSNSPGAQHTPGYYYGIGNINNGVGIAVSENYFYVTDDNGIQKFRKSDGYFENTIGNSGGLGQLNNPKDLTVHNGIIYVADAGNNRIAKFDEDGTFIGSFNGTETSGRETTGQLSAPFGIRIQTDGTIYVADGGNSRIQVFKEKIEPECPYHLISRFLIDPKEEKYTDAADEYGHGLAIGNDGKIYVCNHKSNKIDVYNPDHSYNTSFGKEGMKKPNEIAIDKSGNIFVIDDFYRLSKYDSNYEFKLNKNDSPYTKVAVRPNNTVYASYYSGIVNYIIKFNINLEQLLTIQLESESNISALTVDRLGNIFVAEDYTQNLPIKIYKFDSTYWQRGELEFPDASYLDNKITGLVTDKSGQLFAEFNSSDGDGREVNIYSNDLQLNTHINYEGDNLLSQSIAIAPNGHIIISGYNRQIAESGYFYHEPKVLEFTTNCNIPAIRLRESSLEDIQETTIATTVSPNPSTDNFNLSFPESGTHNIVMYNSTGVEVLRKTVEGSEVNISEPGLVNGLYTIHATSNGVTDKVKVVIAK